MCKPKSEGGMGFKDLKIHNESSNCKTELAHFIGAKLIAAQITKSEILSKYSFFANKTGIQPIIHMEGHMGVQENFGGLQVEGRRGCVH